MPRRQHQEWIYYCGGCGGVAEDGLHLSTIGDYDEALMLSGPEWTLLLNGEEWFCSIHCFLAWLNDKVRAAAEPKEPDNDFTDREDKYYA